jgi:hypothetical protein
MLCAWQLRWQKIDFAINESYPQKLYFVIPSNRKKKFLFSFSFIKDIEMFLNKYSINIPQTIYLVSLLN